MLLIWIVKNNGSICPCVTLNIYRTPSTNCDLFLCKAQWDSSKVYTLYTSRIRRRKILWLILIKSDNTKVHSSPDTVYCFKNTPRENQIFKILIWAKFKMRIWFYSCRRHFIVYKICVSYTMRHFFDDILFWFLYCVGVFCWE